MKKILSLFLISIILLTNLTACKNNNKEDINKIIDWTTMKFILESKEYTMGNFTMQDLINNGWEPNLKYTNVKTLEGLTLSHESGKGYTFLNENYPDFSIQVTAHNEKEEDVLLLDCPVTSITIDALYSLRNNTSIPNLELPGGITLSSKYSNIINTYGEPLTNDNNEFLTWQNTKETENSVTTKELNLMLEKEIGLSRIFMRISED